MAVDGLVLAEAPIPAASTWAPGVDLAGELVVGGHWKELHLTGCCAKRLVAAGTPGSCSEARLPARLRLPG